MLRRLATAVTAAALAGTGAWQGLVSEYFGRIDPEAWEQDHPEPPTPRVELGKHHVRVVETRRIVPSEGLPERADVRTANNNLDVVRHSDGRVYLAWRSAPSHFAGAETVLHVVSSTDEQTWRFETTFSTGKDLREPRFLSLGSRLFLYVSRLGDNPFDFEPEGFSVSELADGRFTPLEPVFEPGYIAWRTKPMGDHALVIAYGGGANLYSYGDDPMTVELLTTRDGRNFEHLDPRRPAVVTGGGSETDFAFQSDGSLFAVVRNEAGDSSGWGSKLCTAPASDLTAWACASDRKKYDSPMVFEHDGETYVVARRNRTADGLYDVSSGPRPVRSLRNQLAYISEAKRCSLFRRIPGQRRLGFVLDLPSRGDTCFPSMIRKDDATRLAVYDYSSPVDGPDLPWAAGQRGSTYVYRHELAFEKR